jgi:hypothetical protein
VLPTHLIRAEFALQHVQHPAKAGPVLQSPPQHSGARVVSCTPPHAAPAQVPVVRFATKGVHCDCLVCMQVFLTEGYLGIVMEYVNGGDMADLVDTWNARNRRRRPPPGTVPAGTQCVVRAYSSGRQLSQISCMPEQHACVVSVCAMLVGRSFASGRRVCMLSLPALSAPPTLTVNPPAGFPACHSQMHTNVCGLLGDQWVASHWQRLHVVVISRRTQHSHCNGAEEHSRAAVVDGIILSA